MSFQIFAHHIQRKPDFEWAQATNCSWTFRQNYKYSCTYIIVSTSTDKLIGPAYVQSTSTHTVSHVRHIRKADFLAISVQAMGRWVLLMRATNIDWCELIVQILLQRRNRHKVKLLTRCRSSSLVIITITEVLCSHTILQKSPKVSGNGPCNRTSYHD